VNKKCQVAECQEQSRSLGFCRRHYKRFKKYGDPVFTFQKLCLNCNKEFRSRYSFQKWCSDDCRIAATQKESWKSWYERNRDRHINNNKDYYYENRQEVIERNKKWVEKKKIADPNYHSKRSRIWRYQLSDEKFHARLLNQNGKCKICHSKFELGNDKTKMPYVDHHHESGKVRGLLCHHCNLVIGHARDEVYIIESAINYLEEKK
jgi:hypothetical protein